MHSLLYKLKQLFNIKESLRNQQGKNTHSKSKKKNKKKTKKQTNQPAGNFYHESQCKSIPDNIVINSRHIHLDPCYKD